MIVALLTGGYLLTRDGDEDPAESPDGRFARLVARPLQLPSNSGSIGECGVQVGAIEIPGIPTEAALGPWAEGKDGITVLRDGPIYAVIGGIPRVMGLRPAPRSRWAIQDETLWISKPSYTGPVLVRGGRLDGQSRIRFGGGPRPRLELRLPAGEWDEPDGVRLRGAPLQLRKGWRAAMTTTRIKTSGCYAFQVDGEGFSYVLAFKAAGAERAMMGLRLHGEIRSPRPANRAR